MSFCWHGAPEALYSNISYVDCNNLQHKNNSCGLVHWSTCLLEGDVHVVWWIDLSLVRLGENKPYIISDEQWFAFLKWELPGELVSVLSSTSSWCDMTHDFSSLCVRHWLTCIFWVLVWVFITFLTQCNS